jgi:CheY-like chemotaxis protein
LRVGICVAGEKHLQTKVVSDGKDAIEAWDNGNFDIILMDLILPDMDGMEVSRKIRELETLKCCKPIPIIAFSVLSKSKWSNKCLESGIDDYIEKPSNIEDIINLIYEYIADFEG